MKFKRDVTFLVGNGFNYFLKNYMDSEEFKEECAKKIRNAYSKKWRARWLQDLQLALKEYCSLMDTIALENTSKSGEFLLEDLERFYTEMGDLASSIMGIMESEIAGKIQENMTIDGKSQPSLTARNVLKVKDKDEYRSFFACLKEEFKTKSIRNFYVYTTNYDNLVDKAFSSNHKDKVYHLHGYFNNRKSIVCCPPKNKKSKTEEALKEFIPCLETSNYVVLFGLGLESDPHIREVLNELSGIHFIIIDANPFAYFLERIEQGNEYAFLRKNAIHFINTVNYMIGETGEFLDAAETPEILIDRLHNILSSK